MLSVAEFKTLFETVVNEFKGLWFDHYEEIHGSTVQAQNYMQGWDSGVNYTFSPDNTHVKVTVADAEEVIDLTEATEETARDVLDDFFATPDFNWESDFVS